MSHNTTMLLCVKCNIMLLHVSVNVYVIGLICNKIDDIYKLEQDYLYFFLEGGFKGIYLRDRNVTLSYVVSEI